MSLEGQNVPGLPTRTARLTAVAQAVADYLARPGTGWEDSQQVTEVDRETVPGFIGTYVERAYAPDWLDTDFWRDNPGPAGGGHNEFKGRRVYVFGWQEAQDGPATRSEDTNLYVIVVAVLRRYDGPDPTPPRAWVDEEVGWVERYVLDKLGDAREEDDPPVPGADPVAQEWTQVYSPDWLRQYKVFKSEVHLTYRKVEDTR